MCGPTGVVPHLPRKILGGLMDDYQLGEAFPFGIGPGRLL